ncbi:MAG: DnaD domain protein [Eubacteriales bacterium]|nr:DnaD domain protein [Eubacteriales bacterium]
MKFEYSESVLYSNTPVPDIFLSEYMPYLKCEYVKLYLHCLFLSKWKKRSSLDSMSKKLDIDIGTIKEGLMYMESIGLIVKKEDSIAIADIKQKEIDKIYRLKTTSTPEEVKQNSELNKKRNLIINAINNSFFQGIMSPAWYTDIDSWFDKYKFEEDVMYSLFQHCYDHKALTKNYITKVAENWYSKNVQNSFDLDRQFIEYKKCRDVGVQIAKKLRLGRYLTEYEEDIVNKWVLEYGYDFKTIELALKKTTGKTSPSFNYIDTIVTDWNKNGLKDTDAISEHEKRRAADAKLAAGAGAASKVSGGSAGSPRNAGSVGNAGSDGKGVLSQKNNFDQRRYDEEFLKKLSNNVGK